MASRSWKQRWLFATLVALVTALGPALEERDVACKADNLLNKFHNTPAVYIPFCQTYLSLAVYETVTVTTNFASQATPAPASYPPALTSSSYPDSRLSSACTCISVPQTTVVLTAYKSSTRLSSSSSSSLSTKSSSSISSTKSSSSSSSTKSSSSSSSTKSSSSSSSTKSSSSSASTSSSKSTITSTSIHTVVSCTSATDGCAASSTVSAIATPAVRLQQASAQVPIPTGFAKALFLDNFATQTAGTLPSSAKWTIDTGTSYLGGPGGWGNWEEETYVASTDTLGISSDGTLRIAPKRVDGKWISGRIETSAANDITCPAGGKMRVEASIKLGAAPTSAQQGMWPAFWMLGSEYRGNYTNWPAIGEIDMLESVNGKASIHHGVHCGTTLGGPCYEPNGRGTSAAFSRGVFHTVSVDIDRTSSDWKNETMVWKIDGLDTWKLTASQIASQDLWSALAWTPKFILLNVAIGGAWPGYSNDSTAEGVDVGMDVKYVAAWST